jgi:two-component system response regulator RstA
MMRLAMPMAELPPQPSPSTEPVTLPLRRPPASRLVLFVGAEMRPDTALADALARDGTRCLWLAGAEQAIRAARLAFFDAVVLDGLLVDGAAGRTLAEVRGALRCPVVVVGRHADEIDEIVALESGADAFLARPLAPRRLRAHLLALLRHHAPAAEPPADETLRCRWHVDRVHNRLHGAAPRPVALTEAQAALLQCLVDADGRVVSRAQLADTLVPSHGHALQARSIDVYVHRLRDRLHKAGAAGHDIEAVRGRGYRLCTLPEAGPD